VQYLLKIAVTALAGGLTFLLTNETNQPNLWQLTMSIFVGGIALVVQFLISAAEETRRTAALVRAINEAATALAAGQKVLGGDSLIRLVEAAGRMNHRDDLQRRFAERQVSDLAGLLRGLRGGRAEHEGEDPDWLLGLTETAKSSIDAISMTSIGKHRGFVDEGEFWASELGIRYLDRQRQAIERGVRIRRLFVVTDETVDDEQIELLFKPHRRINVDVRVLRPEQVDDLYQTDLDDFILFDQQVSYEFHTSRSVQENRTPLIANVSLVVEPAEANRGESSLVERRRLRFETLWKAAEKTSS
jgi:hypothetical protein